MKPSIRSHRYRVVDVSTQNPLEGNPLAVFPDASGIDDVTMQKIAKELNLSETTFVVPARVSDARTAEVIRRVQEDGTCWAGGTTWHGMHAMRISVSNWSTVEADIDRSAEAILNSSNASDGEEEFRPVPAPRTRKIDSSQ